MWPGLEATQLLLQSYGDDTKTYHFRKALSGMWNSWEERERESSNGRSQTKPKHFAGDSEKVTP